MTGFMSQAEGAAAIALVLLLAGLFIFGYYKSRRRNP